MTNSLTVFICSTYSDLSAERESVLDAIRRLQLQHDSMEFFGARAEQPIETCLDEVRRSDVLIVIVGHCYGSIVPGLGISYSEAEYNEGYRLEKPCLVYVRDGMPLLSSHTERDPDKLKHLERWKSTLHQRHTVATFQDCQNLVVKVVVDLSRMIKNLKEAVCPTRQPAAREVIVTDGGIGGLIQNQGSGIGLEVQGSPGQTVERIEIVGRGIGEIVTNTGPGIGKIIRSVGSAASESQVIVNQPVKMAAGLKTKMVFVVCEGCRTQFSTSKVIQGLAGDQEPKVQVSCPTCGCITWV